MIINDVEINVNYDKWAEDIKKEVRDYQEFTKNKKEGEYRKIIFSIIVGILVFFLNTFFCCYPELHTVIYHATCASLTVAFMLFIFYISSESKTFNKVALAGVWGDDLNKLVEYVNEYYENSINGSAMDFLLGLPEIDRIINNWEYLQLLNSGSIIVYAEPDSGLEVTFYNKVTKERLFLNVDHIYADHNEPEDGSEEFVLLIDEDSSVLYRKGIFDEITKVTILGAT